MRPSRRSGDARTPFPDALIRLSEPVIELQRSNCKLRHMKTPTVRPALTVIEGERAHVIDFEVTLDKLRDIRELVREYLDVARDRAERAEARAKLAEEQAAEARIVEQIVCEELALLRAELNARLQWTLLQRLLWAMRGR
jgi:hypothetical protein